MSALAVRMPEEADQPEWLRLRRAYWPDCAPDQHEIEMGTVLADADRAAVFVCSADRERLAGFVEVALRSWYEGCPGSPVAYVEALYVAPEERGRGVGGALLGAAEAWASARGCRAIVNHVHLENDVARDLHSRRGYEETAVRVRVRKQLDAVASPAAEGRE